MGQLGAMFSNALMLGVRLTKEPLFEMLLITMASGKRAWWITHWLLKLLFRNDISHLCSYLTKRSHMAVPNFKEQRRVILSCEKKEKNQSILWILMTPTSWISRECGKREILDSTQPKGVSRTLHCVLLSLRYSYIVAVHTIHYICVNKGQEALA